MAALQIGVDIAYGAPSGGYERRDPLSMEVVGVQERVHYARSVGPPYRESDVDDVVSGRVYAPLQSRTGCLVGHLDGRAAFGVVPIEIGRGVAHRGLYLLQVRTYRTGEGLGHLGRRPRRREVCYESS